MNIYIKSFNRPYFLDRCLATIYMKVQGFGKIIILDDGTPQKYLDKISEKYPEVEIRKSEFWEAKSAMIESGNIDRAELKFPGDFWNRETADAEDYLFMLEDDFFIVEDLNLADIERFMKDKKLLLYKALWLGSPLQIKTRTEDAGNHKLMYADYKINSKHFRRLSNNTYKLRSFFTTFFPDKYYFKTFFLPFYIYYGVSGAVYSAEYFRYMWKDIQKLNEYHQIFRSLEYYEQHGIEKKVGRPGKEAIKTSWLSSATNEFEGVDFNIFEFNRLINDKWLAGEINTLENYPHDYREGYFSKFLSPKQQINYSKWIASFKYPFIKSECETENYGE